MPAIEPLSGGSVVSGVCRASIAQAIAYTKDRPIQAVVPVIYLIATELDIDPAFAIAEAILETGWGRSELARRRHNWYGYTAYYDSSEAARQFATDEDGIRAALQAMHSDYFSPSGRYWADGAGATLDGWARHWIDGGERNWRQGVRTLIRLMLAMASRPDAE